MVDYYQLIARAVTGFHKHTDEARRAAIYEHARGALVIQLCSVTPPLTESEIMRERLSLDEAIRKIEAEVAHGPQAEAAHPALAPNEPQQEPISPEQDGPPAAGREPSSDGAAPRYRYDATRAARGEMLTIEDVLEILSTPLLGIIPESEEVLRASNFGSPITISNPSSSLARAYVDAARRLKGEVVEMTIPGAKKGLFNKLLGRRASHQDRMKTCNTEAGARNLAVDTRGTFMSDRLAGSIAVAPAVNSQQQKMKDCNARAGEQKLTGDARRTFISSCLKGT